MIKYTCFNEIAIEVGSIVGATNISVGDTDGN
jgi:hypothetical protein